MLRTAQIALKSAEEQQKLMEEQMKKQDAQDAAAKAKATRDVSIVIHRRPQFSATVAVVPEPQVGSRTKSPGSVAISMQRSTMRSLVWTT